VREILAWAMSEGNADLALRAVEEFNNTGRLGALFDRLIHPGVEGGRLRRIEERADGLAAAGLSE
jgi:hypothetical protein